MIKILYRMLNHFSLLSTRSEKTNKKHLRKKFKTKLVENIHLSVLSQPL